MPNTMWYDLYLWIIPDSNTLYKLGHIDLEDAKKYSNQWFEANELHDYMYVLEGSTPWSEPKPTIVDISPEWIYEQCKKIVEEA